MTLLSLEELKALLPATSLSDEALALLLSAAEEAIAEAHGPLDYDEETPIIETHKPAGPLLMLGRRASSITTVLEGHVELTNGDDYALRPSGSIITRLTPTGLPRSWRPVTVTVTYVPLSHIADRKRVASELVKLDIAFSPGLASQTIGPWTETYSSGRTYADQRAEVLASLASGSAGFW